MAQPNRKVLSYLLAAGFTSAVAISGGYLVAPYEGEVNKTYVDPVGILTSCFGHTGKELRLGQTYTSAQCYAQLGEDLKVANNDVHRAIKVPLNMYQEAALTSAFFNLGATNLRLSTMVKRFNEGDYKAGCQELTRWVYAQGKRLNGLVARRNDEMKMCMGETKVELN